MIELQNLSLRAGAFTTDFAAEDRIHRDHDEREKGQRPAHRIAEIAIGSWAEHPRQHHGIYGAGDGGDAMSAEQIDGVHGDGSDACVFQALFQMR